MVTYDKYTLKFDDLMSPSHKYGDIIEHIYNSIPAHDIADLTKDEAKDLLGWYPALYGRMSRHFCRLLEYYEARKEGKVKDLKNAFEQALKVIKFQYDALSRKITVDKDEEGIWGATKK